MKNQVTDLKKISKIYIFQEAQPCGQLLRTEQGSIFEYGKTFIQNKTSIAFNLPVSSQAISTSGDNLHPFFAGLLPEGLRLNALIAATKTSASDMFTLLAASGPDTIGDISVGLSERREDFQNLKKINFENKSFMQIFLESIASKDFAMRQLDSAIAGVQPKISAQMISLPIRNKNKDYILKLSPKEFPKIVENEDFFMKLAKKCGINTAATKIIYDPTDNSGLLVSRFDRELVDNKKIKLHVEDACQFLNKYPQDKYRLSYRKIAEGIQNWSSAPQIEILNLIKLVAYSYIIGNGDLHAKNISLIKDPHSNRVALAPAYDLLSTFAYGDQSMALEFMGRDKKLRFKDFLEFGRIFEINAKLVKKVIDKIISKIVPELKFIDSIGFDPKLTKNLQKSIELRIEGFNLRL